MSEILLDDIISNESDRCHYCRCILNENNISDWEVFVDSTGFITGPICLDCEIKYLNKEIIKCDYCILYNKCSHKTEDTIGCENGILNNKEIN